MKEKLTKKLCLVMVIVFTAVLAAAGCGQQTAPKQETKQETKQAENKPSKVKIRFATSWGGGDAKAKYFQDMMSKFVEKNKDRVEIAMEIAAGDELKTKIKVDTAGGNTPDIFTYFGGPILKPLVDGNVVLDMNEYMKESKVFKKEMIPDSDWSYYSFNGKPYGIPMEGYRAAFFVNKKLFEKYNLKYPTTYDEMKEVAKVFNQNGVIPFAMGSKAGNPSHFWFSEMYNQFNNAAQEIANLKAEYKFNTENALKVATIISDMKKNNIIPKDSIANGDWGPSFALYNDEKAAMIYTYPWAFGQMKPEIEKATECIPVPKMPGGTKDTRTFVNGAANYGFVINSKSYKDPAKRQILTEIADFIVSDEMIKELVKSSMFPTKKMDIPKESITPIMNKVLTFTKTMNPVSPHVVGMPDEVCFNGFKSALDELYAGAITPEQFTDKVQLIFDKQKSKAAN